MRSAGSRVVTMIDTLEVGGAERLAVEVAGRVAGHGFVPHVLVTRWSGPLERTLLAHGVPFTILERRTTVSARAMRRAVEVVRRADLVHAHKFGSAVWGALLTQVTRVPLLAHEHNGDPEPARAVRLLNRRLVGPAAVAVVCPSPSVASAMRAQGVPQRRIRIVPNGVDFASALPGAAARQRLGLDADAFVVGIVARLRPEKAHEVLLEAVGRLRAAGRHLTVCIVGSGPCEEALRRRAAELDIAADVVWAGGRADAPALVRAFDVSVICSDWEGLPLAALEGMAAGVPVIGTAVGGLEQVVRDGDGVIVPPRDPDRLAAAIAAVMDHPAEFEQRAAQARSRVRREFGIDTMTARIAQMYTEVLGRGSSGTSSPAVVRCSPYG